MALELAIRYVAAPEPQFQVMIFGPERGGWRRIR